MSTDFAFEIIIAVRKELYNMCLSKDSDRTGHLCSLTRDIAVCIRRNCHTQIFHSRLWSDFAFCWFECPPRHAFDTFIHVAVISLCSLRYIVWFIAACAVFSWKKIQKLFTGIIFNEWELYVEEWETFFFCMLLICPILVCTVLFCKSWWISNFTLLSINILWQNA